MTIMMANSRRELANGVFQAERLIGAYFKKDDSIKVAFIFSIGQNYSHQAALFFLQYFLEGIGRFLFSVNLSGRFI